ncbi:MAG: DNA topoisomerase IB [Gemmatimonadales bacterium]
MTAHWKDHPAAAAAAGLHYVTDTEPGIRRKRAGKGWAYYLPDGSLIRDRSVRKRIEALVIPPAWTNVWICPDPFGHLQVTTRDQKGRKQYRYHPLYREQRDESKFERMLAFSEFLPKLRDRIERDLSLPSLPRRKVLATVVRLLDKTLIRVGNHEYARDNRSYGLTTMRARHVQVSGSSLRFEFRGKSGVKQNVSISDRRLARIVQQCQDLPGQELFQYLDDAGERQTVSSGDINDYLREIGGRDITAKDFRTWAGTMLAARELQKAGPVDSGREAKQNIVRAIDTVAERLGNSRAVCRKYYVHPTVIAAYMRGSCYTQPRPIRRRKEKRERPSGALRRDEAAVLQFLQEEIDSD